MAPYQSLWPECQGAESLMGIWDVSPHLCLPSPSIYRVYVLYLTGEAVFGVQFSDYFLDKIWLR